LVRHIARLEIPLAIAFLAFRFDLFPSLFIDTRSSASQTQLPLTDVVAENVLVVVAIVVIRFGPDTIRVSGSDNCNGASERQQQN
jgi:hypothetical protein